MSTGYTSRYGVPVSRRQQRIVAHCDFVVAVTDGYRLWWVGQLSVRFTRMAMYRQKSPPFEAVQWFEMGDHPAVVPVQMGTGGHTYPFCVSSRGSFTVSSGDWIATDDEGSWPITAESFAKNYEPAAALNAAHPYIGVGPWEPDNDPSVGAGWKCGRRRVNSAGRTVVYTGISDGVPTWGGVDTSDTPGTETEADEWLRANGYTLL